MSLWGQYLRTASQQHDGKEESQKEKIYFIFKSSNNLQVNHFLAVNDQKD